MHIIIGIALLLIIVVVLDCIRYKHTQSQRINDAEHTQRYVTNKRNGWNNNTSSIIPNDGALIKTKYLDEVKE